MDILEQSVDAKDFRRAFSSACQVSVCKENSGISTLEYYGSTPEYHVETQGDKYIIHCPPAVVGDTTVYFVPQGCTVVEPREPVEIRTFRLAAPGIKR
jgi:hypothetical protein